MDWPVATVLLGTLGTLAVGILKWVPRRGDHRGGEIGNGRIYARATDLAEIRAGSCRWNRPITCCAPNCGPT